MIMVTTQSESRCIGIYYSVVLDMNFPHRGVYTSMIVMSLILCFPPALDLQLLSFVENYEEEKPQKYFKKNDVGGRFFPELLRSLQIF